MNMGLDKEIIELKNKFLNSLRKNKFDECLLCGKESNSFCYSHSVPQFVLKNIAEEGKLIQGRAISAPDNIPFLDFEKGTANTGLFRCICRECDNSYFKHYETKLSCGNKLDNRALLEISLKNILFAIFKNYNDKGMFEFVKEITNQDIMHFSDTRDLVENLALLEKLKKAKINNTEIRYNVVFYYKLDYVVPLAYQGRVSLYTDLHGDIVEDLYDFSSTSEDIFGIDLGIFPLKTSTIIILFCDCNNRKYDVFSKQFNELDLNQKLEIINYIIFSYVEDFYLSSNTKYRMYLEDDHLQNLLFLTGPYLFIDKSGAKHFKANLFINRIPIPNFLSSKLALR